ncbi:carbohydrate porin [Candidatus Latescibacterota bacterium]
MDLICSGTLDSLIWGRNAIFGFDVVYINGINPSDTIGDFQGISNIAASQTWKPYETWLQLDIIKERFSVLFGMFDINSEFYFNETAALFINSSFGIGTEFSKSGKNGAPTFPNPGLGLRLKMILNDNVSLKTAIMDGVPFTPDENWIERYKLDRNEGALLTMEISIVSNEEKLTTLAPSSKRLQRRRHRMQSERSNNTYHRFRHQWNKDYQPLIEVHEGGYSKFSLGSWYYTADFDYHNENSIIESNNYQKGNWGIYSTGEKFLWQNSNNPIQAVNVFFHTGICDKDVNKVDISFAGGFVYSGNFFKHFQDQIGFGLSAAHISEGFQKLFINSGGKKNNWEIAAEISYRSQVNNTLSFQPDIQYIYNPGYNPDFDNTTVIGMRLELAF